jgi:hypothetical protein
LKLLSRVDLHAPLGLQFVGQLLSPGAAFEPGDLPRPAVLLEYGGRERFSTNRSRYAFDDVWIVWRYDFEFEAWVEVARAHTEGDTSWTHDLAFLAHQRLFPNGDRPIEERARPVIHQIEASIRQSLESVNREVRACIVVALDQYLASEIVSLSKDLTVTKIGLGNQARYPRIGAQSDTAKSTLSAVRARKNVH